MNFALDNSPDGQSTMKPAYQTSICCRVNSVFSTRNCKSRCGNLNFEPKQPIFVFVCILWQNKYFWLYSSFVRLFFSILFLHISLWALSLWNLLLLSIWDWFFILVREEETKPDVINFWREFNFPMHASKVCFFSFPTLFYFLCILFSLFLKEIVYNQGNGKRNKHNWERNKNFTPVTYIYIYYYNWFHLIFCFKLLEDARKCIICVTLCPYSLMNFFLFWYRALFFFLSVIYPRFKKIVFS